MLNYHHSVIVMAARWFWLLGNGRRPAERCRPPEQLDESSTGDDLCTFFRHNAARSTLAPSDCLLCVWVTANCIARVRICCGRCACKKKPYDTLADSIECVCVYVCGYVYVGGGWIAYFGLCSSTHMRQQWWFQTHLIRSLVLYIAHVFYL